MGFYDERTVVSVDVDGFTIYDDGLIGASVAIWPAAGSVDGRLR